jgi:hypothetical protein
LNLIAFRLILRMAKLLLWLHGLNIGGLSADGVFETNSYPRNSAR